MSVSLPVRAGPRRPSRRSAAPPRTSRASPAARIEELPPRYGESAHPALAHLERALFTDAPPRAGADRRRDPLLRGRRRARRARARRRGAARAAPRRHARRSDIGIVCPSVERWRAPLETALGTLGVPYAIDGEVRLAQTPFGQALLGAAALRLARRHAARPLHVPALAVLRARARARSTSSRAGCAAAPIQTPERVVEEAEKLRGAAAAGARRAARRRRSGRGRAPRSPRGCCATRTGSTAPPVGEIVAARPARVRDGQPAARPSSSAGARSARSSSREDVAGALERQTLRPMRGDEEGRVAVVDLLRARTRRFDVVFVLGLEEGSLPRRGELVAVPRRRRAPRARRARRAPAAARLGRVATATSSTRRARGRSSGSISCARRRPTTAARASRARSGTRCGASSIRTTSAAGRAAGRSRRSRGRSKTRRPSASGCARSPSSRRATAAGADALARANGWERRLERALAAFRRPTRLTHPLVLEQLRRRRRRSTSPSSSASPTARPPGSSSGSSTRARSTPRSTRSCAAPSRTTALYKFFTRRAEGARRRAGSTSASSRTRLRAHARVPRRGAAGRAHGA